MLTGSLITNGDEETRGLGVRVGAKARPGEVWALTGPLAAGKTAFIQGFAQGLGYEGRVTSPTFGLQNVYPGRLTLFHFDWYRLGSPYEVLDLGWEEWLSRGGVVAVEWADKFPDLFPAPTLWMSFEIMEENTRRLVLTAREAAAQERAREVLACWPL